MTFTPIPGFSRYEVSQEGEVRHIKRKQLLKGRLSQGYYSVYVSDGTIASRRNIYIHHLVLLTFVGPRPEGMEVRHLDGDPLNNTLSNLAYGSSAENSNDTVRHGNHNSAKLDERRVRIIRGLHKVDPKQFTLYKLSELFGVEHETIRSVIRRHTWCWVD